MPKTAAPRVRDPATEAKIPATIRDRVKELRRVRAGDLVEHPSNWRTHPKAQLDALRGAMAEIGFAGAVLTRRLASGKLQIIDGHARADLDPDAKLPCLVTDLSAKEADLLLATYDPLGAMAGRDQDALSKLLASVHAEDEALARMLADLGGPPALAEGATDPDDVPTTGPKVKRGDLWLLGDHRILCGDSTKAEDVARLLGKAKPEIMVTDPPYGVNYDPAWREEVGRGASATGRVAADDRADWTPTWRLFEGAVAYVWHSGLHSAEVETSLRSADLIPRAQIIWSKEHLAISRGAYHWRYEPCWYAVRDGVKASWIGGRKQTTVWDNVGGIGAWGAPSNDPANAQVGVGETRHSTQKPAELFRRPLQNHECKSVFEPFSGSGTCLIAAEQTKKRCLAIEIEPKYVGVSIQRWTDFTGRKAVRA